MMRILLLVVFSFISGGILYGQVKFYNGTSQVLGDENVRSTICIGFNDLNGDLRDDLLLMDEGKVLKTFTQNAPGQVFDYTSHLQTSFNGDWSIISGDLNNDGIQEIICSGNEFGSQFLFLVDDKYVKLYGTTQIFSQNTNLLDLNNDGYLDFFVCNDTGENLTFLNNGSGQMVQTKLIDFQTSPEDDMSGNYSSIFTDIDGDDDLDLYIGKCKANVTDPTDPRRVNTLYLNNGDGTYTEKGEEAGLAIGAQSWSVDSGDIDNDGDNDIIVANHSGPHDLMINNGSGHFERRELIPEGYSSYAIQSFFCDFDNNGWLDIIFTDAEQSFILFNDEMSFTRREVFDSGKSGFSVATGDLNFDGFPDLYFGFATSFQDPSNTSLDRVLLNKTNSNNYLDIKLQGSISNRDAVGAKIILYQGNDIQTREVIVGKSYGIMNSTIVHFGLGIQPQVDSIKIKWPSGMESKIDDIDEVNTLYLITEDGCVSSTLQMPNAELCDGQSVEVSIPGDFDSYTWSNGADSKTITIEEPGWYNAIMEKNGCLTYSSWFEVTEELLLSQSEVLPEIDQVICEGDVVKLSSVSGESFLWSTGENTQDIDVMDAGIYSVTVNTNCNTYISKNVEIEVRENTLPVVENDTVMIGESAVLKGDSEALHWYQNKNDLEPIATGSEFVIPELSYTQTYFAGLPNDGFGLEKSLMSNVPLNKVGDSIYTENEVVEFEVYDDLILNSIKVRTQKPGERRFVISDDEEILAVLDVDLGVGVSTINLDYQFSPGVYQLTTNSIVNQNNLGTNHPQFSYSDIYVENDKRIEGYFEIRDNELNPGISPYFFDWDIDYGNYNCEPRYPVYAVVKMNVNTTDVESKTIVYPNPTSGEVFIKTDISLPYNIDVFDVAGNRVVDRIEVYKNESFIELPNVGGLYFMKIFNKQGGVVKRVFVY